MPRRAHRRGLLPITSLLLVSVLVLAGATTAAHLLRTRPPPTDDGIRSKCRCEPLIEIYRQDSTGTVSLLDPSSDRIAPGERYQVTYNTMGSGRYGLLFSIDSRHHVTPYHTGPIPPGTQYSEHAYIIDDTPGAEDIYFLVSDQPLSLPDVLLDLRGSLDTHAHTTASLQRDLSAQP